MPDHKRQHYVPRCYFKPFTLGRKGKAINLLHLASGRLIRNAPIKGQCARDYIYGEDLKLERALQGIEGRYAATMEKLEADPAGIGSDDLFFLEGLRFYSTSGLTWPCNACKWHKSL